MDIKLKLILALAIGVGLGLFFDNDFGLEPDGEPEQSLNAN